MRELTLIGSVENSTGDWLIFAQSAEQKCACPLLWRWSFQRSHLDYKWDNIDCNKSRKLTARMSTRFLKNNQGHFAESAEPNVRGTRAVMFPAAAADLLNGFGMDFINSQICKRFDHNCLSASNKMAGDWLILRSLRSPGAPGCLSPSPGLFC
jgi:hypothetical protein